MNEKLRVSLGFVIENRAGSDVLEWNGQGCRPATSEESALWAALCRVTDDSMVARLASVPLWESKIMCDGYPSSFERTSEDVAADALATIRAAVAESA